MSECYVVDVEEFFLALLAVWRGSTQHSLMPGSSRMRQDQGAQPIAIVEIAAAIDVLAPDHIGRRAQLRMGVGRTIEAPGTTQAFGRSSIITVEVDGSTAKIRRPDLVGALLGKAAAVVKISSQTGANRAKHVRDFDSLAKLLGVLDGSSTKLTTSEGQMLKRLLDEPGLSDLGRASLRLLSGSG